jgi:CDP-diglyceride synthetase
MPCHPGFSVSLAAGMAYLGYVAPKYAPIREGLLPLIGGVVLLIAVATDLFLYFIGRRAQAPKEVSHDA